MKTHHIEDGQPPELTELIGRRIDRAWLLPEGKCLAIRLEGGKFIMAEAVHTDIPGVRATVQIETGDERPGAYWGDLDQACPQTVHSANLRGRTFSGLDCEVLVFDSCYGAQFTPHGIQWVKLAD
jgi:hypothetical protein